MLKPDLELLKVYLLSVENTIDDAESIFEDEDPNLAIVELSKAIGVLAGISNECSMLIGDIKSIITGIQSKTLSKEVVTTSSSVKGSSGSNLN